MKLTRHVLATGATVIVALAVAACGSTATSSPSSGGAKAPGKIALLLPETKTARYEAADKPDFVAKLKALGFMGIMVLGSHHQAHHLLIARGELLH